MDWSSGKWVPGPNVFFVVCCNFLFYYYSFLADLESVLPVISQLSGVSFMAYLKRKRSWINQSISSYSSTGPGCDFVCAAGAMLAGIWKVPMVSYGCVSPDLTETHRIPTFARTTSSILKISEMVKVSFYLKHWRVEIEQTDKQTYIHT